jgi:omega-amidase
MQNLKLKIVQPDLIWESPQENRNHLEKLMSGGQPADLIILPEMFTTGFTMDASKWAENPDEETTQWLQQMAKSFNAVVTGSFIIKENGDYFNRLLWVKPDGDYSIYNKKHLFRLAKEERTYSPGKGKIVEEINGWRICPFICYDLRFPVWLRNKEEYDLSIFVANWPERRSTAWKTLLRARAIENLCYVAGCNRSGTDGNDIFYSGDSALISPDGEAIAEISKTEGIIDQTLDLYDLKVFRRKFQFHRDRDSFTIN